MALSGFGTWRVSSALAPRPFSLVEALFFSDKEREDLIAKCNVSKYGIQQQSDCILSDKSFSYLLVSLLYLIPHFEAPLGLELLLTVTPPSICKQAGKLT